MSKPVPKIRTVVEPNLTALGCYDLEQQYAALVTQMLIEEAVEEES